MLSAGAEGSKPLDPLMQGADLPLRFSASPLGFPLELETNSDIVIRCARSSWGEFPKIFDEPPVRLRIVTSSGNASGEQPPPALCRAQGHLFTIMCDRDNHAVCDFEKGVGAAWVNSSVTSHPEYLRFYFLEAMAYATISSLHLTTIHAASVAVGDMGILLCGTSGSGKTSLAYACARSGFTYVSDDASSLVRKYGNTTIVGKPFLFRFRADCSELFPELRGHLLQKYPNGKPTIELKPADLGVRVSTCCSVRAIIFLNRDAPGTVCLKEVPPEQTKLRLTAELPVLTPDSYVEQLRSLDVLAKVPAFELYYNHIDGAVERLRALVDERACS